MPGLSGLGLSSLHHMALDVRLCLGLSILQHMALDVRLRLGLLRKPMALDVRLGLGLLVAHGESPFADSSDHSQPARRSAGIKSSIVPLKTQANLRFSAA